MKNYSYYLLIAMSLFFVRCGELETQTEFAATNQSSISSPETPLKTRANDTEYFSCFIGFISNEYIKNIDFTYHVGWEGYGYGTLISDSKIFFTETMPEKAVEYPLNDDIFAKCRYVTVRIDKIYLPDLSNSELLNKGVHVIIQQTINGDVNQWETLYNETTPIGYDGDIPCVDIYAVADFYRLPNGTFDGQLGFYYSINIEIPE